MTWKFKKFLVYAKRLCVLLLMFLPFVLPVAFFIVHITNPELSFWRQVLGTLMTTAISYVLTLALYLDASWADLSTERQRPVCKPGGDY